MKLITKNARNIPLQELNNFCILNDVELDVKEEEIVLCEVCVDGEEKLLGGEEGEENV